MFSCKSRYACGGSKPGQHSDSDEDSSYGFKIGDRGNRTRAVLSPSADTGGDDHDYHIYGNVTFGYKPILKTRLSSAASSVRRRTTTATTHVKRTVSFTGVRASPNTSPDVLRRRYSLRRPPPPCYSVAVRRASSFSATRRNAAEILARCRQRMPLPHENVVPSPRENAVPSPRENVMPCTNTSRVVVDVHHRVAPTNCGVPTVPQGVMNFKRTVESPPSTAQVPGLGKSPSNPSVENVPLKAPNATDIAGQRMDSYRFSMANLEDTQDVDLDAVLGELCALESQYQSTTSLMESEKIDSNSINRMLMNSNQPQTVVRTDSPDNDSAFSDCVSLLSSSESSASSSGTTNHSGNKESSKAEKIRLALQKMKEASVKKLFIKVFDDDGGAKSLLVDEGMRCSYVMRQLADKHHINLGPRWGLVEHLPDLYMERVYEEHELLVDNLMLWTRDSKNRLLFVERPERTMVFEDPTLFNKVDHHQSPSHGTSNFAQEYFCNGGLPNIEGPLYIKTDSRKGWKKYYSVLRASGLYYYKDKASKSPKDLVCLSTFDVNQVYYGVGWKKKYKAPTEHCFAIKHPCLQQPKSTKYIKYVCAEDERTLHKWMSAIRIVKYGQQMLENYETALVSGSQTLHCATEIGRTVTNDLSTMLEDIESGLSSDSGSSSGCDVAFESDYPPCGTIKRKPPKLPLTATTRQLTYSVENSVSAATAVAASVSSVNHQLQQKPVKTVKFADHYHHHHSHHYRTPSMEALPPPPPELLVNHDDTNEEDDDIMCDVPPPPPKLLSPPSTAFLADLHRVVNKKWQVAQKCKLDTMATPHEVLGFRDPQYGDNDTDAAGNYSREANVSNWVAEHYGPNNLYENVYPINNDSKPTTSCHLSPQPPPPPPNRMSTLKKRPPPPPPPRSEKTQLTTICL